MKKKEISVEELEKSLQYLDAFAKGQNPAPVEEKPAETAPAKEPEKPAEEEPEDELYTAHKNRMAAYLDKAMCHKAYMDKIKKGEPLPDEAFDDLEDETNPPAKETEKPAETEVKKGNENELGAGSSEALDELVKAKVSEALSAQKAESDAIIKGLKDQIEKLSDQPVRKTLIKGADAVTLKKAISGEKVDNKTLLSISLQKAKVSEALYQAYEAETDEFKKGQLGDAVAEFESTGSYISPEIAQIMEDKGFRFIK